MTIAAQIRPTALNSPWSGSSSRCLWSVMEIAYLCRMRGIEVIRLIDAHATDAGLRVSRVKGSNDNIVRWNPRLCAAWEATIAIRAEILARPANRSRPVPIRAEGRYVFVSQSGMPLSKSALNQAWQDFMPAAIEAGIITPEQRFTLHALKHRGITDSVGGVRNKRAGTNRQRWSSDTITKCRWLTPPSRPNFQENF
jgi:hypothetical protein